jgi:hypothetical protein
VVAWFYRYFFEDDIVNYILYWRYSPIDKVAKYCQEASSMVRERVARVGSLRRVRVIWKLSAQISKSYLVAAATSGVPRSWSPRHALGRAWS